MHLVSPLIRTLLFKALYILSDDSLEINACLALCRTVKLSARIVLVSCWMSAGGLSVKLDGSLGFSSNTSWNNQKPCTLANKFLAVRHQANIKYMLRCCDSSNTLFIMSAMVKLCLSTSPLLNGDSAAVTLTVMFIDSAISTNFETANSLPLSVKNFSGAPYICIHDLKITFLRMTSGSFDLAKLDTDNIVAWSIKCNKILP